MPLLNMAVMSKRESGDHRTWCTGSRHVCKCNICSEAASRTTTRCWLQLARWRPSGEKATSPRDAGKLSEKFMFPARRSLSIPIKERVPAETFKGWVWRKGRIIYVGDILQNKKCLEMECAGQREQETFAEDVLWV